MNISNDDVKLMNKCIDTLKSGVLPSIKDLGMASTVFFAKISKTIEIDRFNKDKQFGSVLEHSVNFSDSAIILALLYSKSPSKDFIITLGHTMNYYINNSEASMRFVIKNNIHRFREIIPCLSNNNSIINNMDLNFNKVDYLKTNGFMEDRDKFINLILIGSIKHNELSQSDIVEMNSSHLYSFHLIIHAIAKIYGVGQPESNYGNQDWFLNEDDLPLKIRLRTARGLDLAYIYSCEHLVSRHKIFNLDDNLVEALIDTDIDESEAITMMMPFSDFSIRFVVSGNKLGLSYMEMFEVNARIIQIDKFMAYGEKYIGCNILHPDVKCDYLIHITHKAFGKEDVSVRFVNDLNFMSTSFMPQEIRSQFSHDAATNRKREVDASMSMIMLIIKTILFVTTHRVSELIANTPEPKIKARGDYVVRRPSVITVGFNKRYTSFSMGNNAEIKACEVRGHFKMQPHGEGRKERKRIWIIPYIRGGVETNEDQVYIIKS